MNLKEVNTLLSEVIVSDKQKPCLFFSTKRGDPLFFTDYDQSTLWGCGCSDGMIFFFSKDQEKQKEITWDYFFTLFSSLKNECANEEGKVHSHYVLDATCDWYFIFLDEFQEEMWQPLCLTRIEQTDQSLIFWFSEEEPPF